MIDSRAISRRALLQTGVAGGTVLLLGACVNRTGTNAANGPTAAGSPRPGGTLTVATPDDVTALDPIATSANAGMQTFYLHLVYNRLFDISPQGKIVPELAEKVDVSADGKQVSFQLRKGVLFHTGRELTSDDIEWNIKRIATAKTNNFYSTAQKLITKIEKADKYNITVTLSTPTIQVLNFFDLLYISDQQTMDGPNAAKTAVGTGPFKMTSWRPGQGMQFDKYDRYWQSGVPYLDRVTQSVVANAQTTASQFQVHQVDMAVGLALQDAKRVTSNGAGQIVLDPVPQVVSLVFDYAVPPFDNPLVRQAFQYAIDRERIAQIATASLGEATSVIWPKASSAYDAGMAKHYTFDLNKAKSLLQQAGVSSATVHLQTGAQYAEIPAVAEILRGDLAKIGITLQTQVLQNADFTNMLNTRKSTGIIALNLNILPDPGATLNQVFFVTPNAAVAPGHFSDARYSAEVAKAGDLTLSDADRLASVKNATQIMLDSSFIAAICTYPADVVAAPKVHDLQYFLSPLVSKAWVSA